MEKIVIEVEVETAKGKAQSKDLTDSIDGTKESVDETGKSVSGLTGKLDQMTGGAVTAFKSFVAGAKAGIGAMNGLKVAIAATGIGALVIAILAIKEAFTATEEGQNKFAKIMAVINVVIGNFIDLVSDLGEFLIDAFSNPMDSLQKLGNFIKENLMNRFEGLMELIPALGKAVKQLFSGDFAAAGETAANAVAKVGLGVEDMTGKIKGATEALKDFNNEMANEIEAAQKVADARAKADKIERDLLVERARVEGEVAELKLKARKEDEFTAEQRKQFLMEANDLQTSILNKETEVLELRAEAIKMENTFSKSNKEALDAQAQAEAALLRNRTDRLNAERSIQRELNTVNSQVASAASAYEKERLAAIKSIETAVVEANDVELTKVREKYALLLEAAKKFNLDTTELEAKRREDLGAFDMEKIDPIAEKTAQINQEIELQKNAGLQAITIRNQTNAAIIKSDQEAADAKKKIDQIQGQATMSVVQTVANTVAQIAGEQSAAGKAAAVAATTIATIQSATSSFNSLSGIPIVGPALGAVAAAAAVVSGVMNVKKILAVKTPGSSGGGGGVSAPSISAPSVGNSIGLINPVGNAQGIGDGITNTLEQNPPRAYVVSEDVVNGVDLDNKIRGNGNF